MDELGEFIAGILIAFLIIIAMIYIFVYIVIPVAVCYYLGKEFYNQMKKCKLGGQAKLTLGIIGGLSILIAALLVRDAGINGFVIAPLSVLIFLLIAVPVIAIWIYTKKKRFLDVRHDLQSQEADLEIKIIVNEHNIELLQNENNSLKSEIELTIKNEEQLEKYVAELCETAPRAYTILKREWTEGYSKMEDKEIEEQSIEYKNNLNQINRTETIKKTEYAIRFCLIQIERIKRINRQPLQAIASNTEKIQALEQEVTVLKEKIARVTEQINRNENAYQSFLDSRVVLD